MTPGADFDFVVVGAGSAGCVIANRLSASARVLLLEAGGSDRAPEVRIPAAFSKLFKTARDWDFETGPEPGADGRRLYLPRGRMIGGSSSMNAMIYIRGRSSDYDRWELMGATGWSWQNVYPHFLAVEDNSRGPSPFHATGGELRVEDLRAPSSFTRRFVEAAIEVGIGANPDFNGTHQAGVGLFQVTQRRGRRWSAADAFLYPVIHRPTLTVVEDALVDKVLLRGNRAVGVSYLARGRSRQARAAEAVILAAGSIGSPAILQRSGIGDPRDLAAAGIAVHTDLPAVGRNLQDHPVILLMHRSTRPGTLDDAETVPNLARYLLARRGPLTSNVGEAGAFVASGSGSADPDIQFHFGPVHFADHGLGDFDGHAYTTGPLLLNPASRGWVRVRSNDPTLKPEIVGNALTEPEDIVPLLAGLEIGREILAASAFDEVRGEEVWPGEKVKTVTQLRQFVRRRVELLYHPCGTCRIGSPTEGVVDPELQVHGVEGLRVADASVMPTIPSGNINAPTVMIGTRASEMILRDRGPIRP